MTPHAQSPINVANLHRKIDRCIRTLKESSPVAVELGQHLCVVRDHHLYMEGNCTDLYSWIDRHHGIKETQSKKLLKIG